MKKIVQFLVLMLLMVIGSVGQVWAADFAFTHAGLPSSSGTYYLYNVGQDAFAYVTSDGKVALVSQQGFAGYSQASPFTVASGYTISYSYNGLTYYIGRNSSNVTYSTTSANWANNDQTGAVRLRQSTSSWGRTTYYYLGGTRGNNLSIMTSTPSANGNYDWRLVTQEQYDESKPLHSIPAEIKVSVDEATNTIYDADKQKLYTRGHETVTLTLAGTHASQFALLKTNSDAPASSISFDMANPTTREAVSYILRYVGPSETALATKDAKIVVTAGSDNLEIPVSTKAAEYVTYNAMAPRGTYKVTYAGEETHTINAENYRRLVEDGVTTATLSAAIPSNGYYFAGWGSTLNGGAPISTDASYTGSFEKGQIVAPAFLNVVVLSDGLEDAVLVVNDGTLKKSGYTEFVTQHADSKEDFSANIINASIDNAFEITDITFSANKLRVSYQYTMPVGNFNPQTAMLQVASKGGESHQSISLVGRAVSVVSVVDEAPCALPATNEDAPTEASVSFAVFNASAAAEFENAVINNISNPSVEFTFVRQEFDAENDLLTVYFNYNPKGIYGSYTADVTLTSKTGSSYTAEVRGIIVAQHPAGADAALLVNDVEVKNGTWAEVLAFLNAGVFADVPVLRLYKDLDLADANEAARTISKSVVLDLYSKSLSVDYAAGKATEVLNINGGANVTITDSEAGGSIVMNAALTDAVSTTVNAVKVNSGTLTLEVAKIAIVNNTQHTSSRTYAVSVAADGVFVMNSGTLDALAYNYAYALNIAQNSVGNAINGGKLISKSNDHSRGVLLYGELTYGGYTTMNVTTTVGAEPVGVYMSADKGGKLTMNGGSINVTSATNNAFGIYGLAGTEVTTSAHASVSATSTSGDAYAIYMSSTTNVANLIVNNGTFVGGKSAIYVNGSKASAVVNAGKMKGATQDVLIANSGALQLNGGYYAHNAKLLDYATAGRMVYDVPENLLAYEEGYIYGVGNAENGAVVCKIFESNGNRSYYARLEDALTYANMHTESEMTIILTHDYTMSQAGYYTLPANATLLVPKTKDQTTIVGQVPDRVVGASGTDTKPFRFRLLSMAAGVHLDVAGTIELSGTQYVGYAGRAEIAHPDGAYGQLDMAAGSSMTLDEGSRLIAWGYVTGEGEIDARHGANVFEDIQISDWKGGTVAATMAAADKGKKNFPINNYFIQNVEAPVTYRPGSKLFAAMGVNISDQLIVCNNVQIIGVEGDIALFLMDPAHESEDTWVRKKYDVAADKQVYEINSSANLSAMKIALANVPVMGSITMNSADFVLPITNNMKVHLLSGYMGITEDTEFLPGAELEINKTAIVEILEGKTVYVYDCQDWKKYSNHPNARIVHYTPTANGAPTKRDVSSLAAIGDASIFVHGTFNIMGALRTTPTGGHIYSSNEDAGTIYFEQAAPTNTAGLNQITASTNFGSGIQDKLAQAAGLLVGKFAKSTTYDTQACPSAWLLNADDTFTKTGAANPNNPGATYCYIDGNWVSLVKDGCFEYDEPNNQYYIKPQDYVAVKMAGTSAQENTDHTYSSLDGERLFIVEGDCQWWEVEPVDDVPGVFHCLHPLNDKYYQYNFEAKEWEELIVAITWANWDGTPLLDSNGDEAIYVVPFGSHPKYLGKNPTREQDYKMTYNFKGWLPEITSETVVTESTVFKAQYAENVRMFTITFEDESGNVLDQQYLPYDATPVCKNEPNKKGFYMYWNPSVANVTRDQVYRATYQAKPKEKFAVTFLNYDGTQIGDIQTVWKNVEGEADNLIAEPEAGDLLVPASSLDKVYSEYTWTPSLDSYDYKADQTFTAVFTPQVRQYDVNFYYLAADGDDYVQVGETQHVNYGVVPTAPVMTSLIPAGYEMTGWTPTLSAVTGYEGGATEIAYYTEIIESAIRVDALVAGFGDDGEGDHVVPVGKTEIINDLTIQTDGEVSIPASSTLQVGNLRLEAVPSYNESAILNAQGVLNVTNSACVEITLNPEGMDNTLWYSFSVPFEVALNGGVKRVDAEGNEVAARQGANFRVYTYDEADRATNGVVRSNWVLYKGSTLRPGVFYLADFDCDDYNVYRFYAKDLAHLNNLANITPSVTGSGENSGWNGIANNGLTYAKLLGSYQYMQMLNSVGNVFNVELANEYPIAIGNPVFIQATAVSPIVVAYSANTQQERPGTSAPRRVASYYAPTTENMQFVVELTADGARKYDDHIFISASEDAVDEYIAGRDLQKMSMGTAKVARMWVNNYGKQLAVNEAMLVNDVAEYSIGMSAPKSGEYVLSLKQLPAEGDMYLTYNDQAIWNFSDGEYFISLTAGTNNGYGLRYTKALAPGAATAIDEAVVDADGNTQKVLINNVIYIIRENHVYDVQGRLVK